MREAPAIFMVNELTKRGANVNVYDPKAMEIAKAHYFKNNQNVKYSKSKYDALLNATALLLLTEWKEFRSPDFLEIKKQLVNPVIFDGRNQYNGLDLQAKGIEYYQIGK